MSPHAADGTTDVPKVSLDPPFVDDRGAIRPLVEGDVRSVLLIESSAGAVRGNHFHRTDWHYSFVVSGRMEYFWRSSGDTDAPKSVMVEAGEMVFSPAGTEHAMRFPVDSVFLALSGNPRDQAAYEDDVVRVPLIGG